MPNRSHKAGLSCTKVRRAYSLFDAADRGRRPTQAKNLRDLGLLLLNLEAAPTYAEDFLARAVRRLPRDIEARMGHAEALFALDRFEEAERELAIACRLDPNDPDPIVALIQVRASQGRDTLEIAARLRALPLDSVTRCEVDAYLANFATDRSTQGAIADVQTGLAVASSDGACGAGRQLGNTPSGARTLSPIVRTELDDPKPRDSR